jgi:hypothetical protein
MCSFAEGEDALTAAIAALSGCIGAKKKFEKELHANE